MGGAAEGDQDVVQYKVIPASLYAAVRESPHVDVSIFRGLCRL